MATLGNDLNPRLQTAAEAIAANEGNPLVQQVLEDQKNLYTGSLGQQKAALKDYQASSNQTLTRTRLDHNIVKITQAIRDLQALTGITREVRKSLVTPGANPMSLDASLISLGHTLSCGDKPGVFGDSREVRFNKARETVRQTLRALANVETQSVPLLENSFSTAEILNNTTSQLNSLVIQDDVTIAQMEEKIDQLSQTLQEAITAANSTNQEIKSFQAVDVTQQVAALQKEASKTPGLFASSADKAALSQSKKLATDKIAVLNQQAANVAKALVPFVQAMGVHSQILNNVIQLKETQDPKHFEAILKHVDAKSDLLKRIISSLQAESNGQLLSVMQSVFAQKGLDESILMNAIRIQASDTSASEGSAAEGSDSVVNSGRASPVTETAVAVHDVAKATTPIDDLSDLPPPPPPPPRARSEQEEIAAAAPPPPPPPAPPAPSAASLNQATTTPAAPKETDAKEETASSAPTEASTDNRGRQDLLSSIRNFGGAQSLTNKKETASSAPTEASTDNSGRQDLLSAIRNFGGVQSLTKTSDQEDNKTDTRANTGDSVMDAVANRLGSRASATQGYDSGSESGSEGEWD